LTDELRCLDQRIYCPEDGKRFIELFAALLEIDVKDQELRQQEQQAQTTSTTPATPSA
jgi:hypothetical protein